MGFRLSISNSSRSSASFPRPAPAAWIALAVTALTGWMLSSIAGYRGSVLREAFPNIRREAFRYNSVNGERPSQVLILGTSRMRHGIVEEQLAYELGSSKWQAINLSLDSSGLREIYGLIKELDFPKGGGEKIAVVEIHPAEFLSDSSAPPESEAQFFQYSKRPSLRMSIHNAWPARQSIVLWLQEFYYGWFADHFTRFVPVPPPLPALLWTVDAEARRRAVINMQPKKVVGDLGEMGFQGDWALGLRMVVRELKKRSFRVILLCPPSHSSYNAAFAAPSNAFTATAYSDTALNLNFTGADALLVLRDAKAIGADDGVFFDYSHLNQTGARLETSKVAGFIKAFLTKK